MGELTVFSKQASKCEVAALWLLFAWCPLPWVGLLQLLGPVFGYYDPVRDDSMATDSLPYYWCFWGSQILVGVVVTVALKHRLFASSTPPSRRALTQLVVIGWAAQFFIVLLTSTIGAVINRLTA